MNSCFIVRPRANLLFFVKECHIPPQPNECHLLARAESSTSAHLPMLLSSAIIIASISCCWISLKPHGPAELNCQWKLAIRTSEVGIPMDRMDQCDANANLWYRLSELLFSRVCAPRAASARAPRAGRVVGVRRAWGGSALIRSTCQCLTWLMY